MKIRVRKCIGFRRIWPPQPRQGRQNLAQGAGHGLGLRRASEPRKGRKRGATAHPLTPLPGYGLLRGLFPRARALG
jgi:hypothetical protein